MAIISIRNWPLNVRSYAFIYAEEGIFILLRMNCMQEVPLCITIIIINAQLKILYKYKD